MIVNLLLRRTDEIRRDDRDAVSALAFGHLRQAYRFARCLSAGAGINGHTFVHMSNRRGDDFLLLTLVEGVKLAVGAEDENTMNAVGDEVIEEPRRRGRSRSSLACMAVTTGGMIP